MKTLLTICLLAIMPHVCGAQNKSSAVWIADFAKTKTGHRDDMLFFLEKNWKLYRDSALASGYITGYRLLETTPDSIGNFDFILLTEFADSAAYANREAVFQPIMKAVRLSGPVLKGNLRPNDVRELVMSKTARTVFEASADKHPNILISQDSQHLERLRQIDKDIWTPFYEAYATQDADKYLSLHTPDFIRANGGNYPQMSNLQEYAKGVKAQFARNRETGKTIRIDFTFFERVAGAETASERGIYRYTSINPSNGKTLVFYGKFHVILRKLNNVWKIAVDYDSDEDGTIDEADFLAGLPPGKYGR